MKTMKQQHIIAAATLLLLAALTCTAAGAADTPCMLCDFETGENINSPIGGGTGFFRHQSNTEDHLPVASPGAVGTGYCVEYITEDWELAGNGDQPQSFYIDNPNSRTLIEEANGANRFRAWIKLPTGYEQGHDWNFHFGTYTRDPEIPSNIQGSHYYHYFNLPASPYWTRIIANDHPQHRTGNKTAPTINPTAPDWDYYDGFTRFYFHCSGGTYPQPGEWSWFIDEVEFYYEEEIENAGTITSISCSYFGDGHFQVNWHGNSQYDHNDHHYEVRYSASPITNANYDSATISPGCSDVTKVPDSYNWMKADFTIPITSRTAYFAIKDLETGYDACIAGIDYPVSGGSGDDAVCGDLDDDGKIGTADLLLLLRRVVTGTPLAGDCVCDIDGSGTVNALDARLLMGHIHDPAGYSLHCGC